MHFSLIIQVEGKQQAHVSPTNDKPWIANYLIHQVISAVVRSVALVVFCQGPTVNASWAEMTLAPPSGKEETCKTEAPWGEKWRKQVEAFPYVSNSASTSRQRQTHGQKQSRRPLFLSKPCIKELECTRWGNEQKVTQMKCVTSYLVKHWVSTELAIHVVLTVVQSPVNIASSPQGLQAAA